MNMLLGIFDHNMYLCNLNLWQSCYKFTGDEMACVTKHQLIKYLNNIVNFYKLKIACININLWDTVYFFG